MQEIKLNILASERLGVVSFYREGFSTAIRYAINGKIINNIIS